MMTLDEGEAMVMMEGNETLERAEREESMELEEGGPESVKSKSARRLPKAVHLTTTEDAENEGGDDKHQESDSTVTIPAAKTIVS